MPLTRSQTSSEDTKQTTGQIDNSKQVIIVYQPLQPKLYIFDGTPRSFPEWLSIFENTVENDQQLDEVRLFRLFLEALGNSAKRVSHGLIANRANYQIAKQRAQALFGSPYMIRQDIYKMVRSMPPITDKDPLDMKQTRVYELEDALRALKSVNTSQEALDETFAHLASTKLPRGHVRRWLDHVQREHRTADNLIKMAGDALTGDIDEQEWTLLDDLTNHRPSQPRSGVAPRVRTNISAVTTEAICLLCSGTHRTYLCREGDATSRKESAVRKRLCFKCLRANHRSAECSSTYQCRLCRGAHSSAICVRTGNQLTQSTNSASSAPTITTISKTLMPARVSTIEPASTSTNTAVHIHQVNAEQPQPETSTYQHLADPTKIQSHYQTILVRVNNKVVRAFLDSGAGRSLIREDLAEELRLSEYAKQNLGIRGLEGGNSNRLVHATLCSLDGKTTFNGIFSVLATLGSLNLTPVPLETRKELARLGYPLCDAIDGTEYPVQIIIGVDYYSQILYGEPIITSDHMAVQNTLFGWCAYGITVDLTNTCASSTQINTVILDTYDSPMVVACNYSNKLSTLEVNYLDRFMKQHIHRTSTGAYSVDLPWIQPVKLADNKQIAFRRFNRLMIKLKQNGGWNEYSQAMQEMITNYAEPSPTEPPNDSPTYFLPHHPVIRPEKATTKTRIVFDGSSHAPGQKSLNDYLFKGFTSWNIFDILLNFRTGPIAVVADIEKAFLRIQVETQDRNALNFWWLNHEQQLSVYRFRSVPFGTSASPFLLYAVMTHHFYKWEKEKRETVELIRNRFYVDDLVLALPSTTPEQLTKLRSDTRTIFYDAHMNVRKWRTNYQQVDNIWAPDADPVIKVLGHEWNLQNDTLNLSLVVDRFLTQRLTKRDYSSFISSVYDPMGLVAPVSLQHRLLLRKIWTYSDLDWDHQLPEELYSEAILLIQDAHHVQLKKFPRNVLSSTNSTSLRIYCDASKVGVAVAAYCVHDQTGLLIYAKAKLARMKTIPELELDSLHMAAQTANTLNSLYPFNNTEICSDSLINLQRLCKHPNDQPSSTALRINNIKRLTTATFRHVTSEKNLADIASRGCSMAHLVAFSNWWTCPPLEPDSKFCQQVTTGIFSISPTSSSGKCSCPKHPNYRAALHYYLKLSIWLKRVRYKEFENVDVALLLFIKTMQHNHFYAEREACINQTPIDPTSVLRNYSFYLDSFGLLRLRTRLPCGRLLTENETSPYLLPGHCHLSWIVVLHHHNSALHPGVDRTVTVVRERYYVIGLKSIAKAIINRCLLCTMKRKQCLDASHGQLPEFRIDITSPPFTHTGIDIFGPLKVATVTAGKKYGLIFCCATTRAVHLELLLGMTAVEVFQALLRFIARRGVPSLIFSDNGTQLVALKKQLLTLIDELKNLHPEFELRTKWIHLTPASPWRGGFYERMIRSIKESLTTLTYHRRPLTEFEIYTSLMQIEAMINSRPLFTHNSDNITPAHFFRGKSLTGLPTIGYTDARTLTKSPVVLDYIASLRLVNNVCLKWREAYLLTLRNYHQNPAVNTYQQLVEGDVVILKCITPMDTWPIGTILKTIPSNDGRIRTVVVRTHERGKLVTKHRSIQTVIPFECMGKRSINPESQSENAAPPSM